LLSHNSSMLGIIESDYDEDIINLENITSLILFSDGILDLISHDYDEAELQLKTFLKTHKEDTINSLKKQYINNKNLPDDLTFSKVYFK